MDAEAIIAIAIIVVCLTVFGFLAFEAMRALDEEEGHHEKI